MKTKITTADIHNAVNDLIAEEKQPTLVAVRQKVGGGSYTTISEAMKSYKANKESEQQTPKEEAPSSVIASASQLAIDIWNVANNLANQKITHEREALEKTRKEYEQQQAQAVELADSLANELDEAREVIEQQKAELSKAQEQAQELLTIKQMLSELIASKVEPKA